MFIRALMLMVVVSASAPGACAFGLLDSKPKKPKFELKDGDRVVFLGNTLIERAQKYGYWETMLTARYPNRKIIFRNLGWDGDTVWAESRGIFGTPEKGYADMLKHVGRIKPTVLFLGYGNNEAFAGKKGLPRFVKQYNKLLDDLTKVSAKGARFVLLAPTMHEALPKPYTNPKETNRSIQLYANAIERVSQERKCWFVNFANATKRLGDTTGRFFFGPLTTNGLHFSRSGYVFLMDRIQQDLNQETPYVHFHIAKGKGETFRVESDDAKIKMLSGVGHRIRFKVANPMLPILFEIQRNLQAHSLTKGFYTLKVDGKEVATRYSGDPKSKIVPCGTWAAGQDITEGPEFDQFEKLRQTIIAKNRLYFHSWRPQNITYLFLFRKHEQGQNAKDVKEFLKLVAAKEKEIDRLKKPVTRTYELIRVKAKK